MSESTKKRWAFRFDLGIPGLTREWRAMFDRRTVRHDVVAGLTVACIAIPLSLAIALASGVPPVVGLFTAIVSGIVCALFGGTTLAVSGPAAAMAVLIASVVQSYGVAGLLFVGITCGVLQLVTGVLGLGKIIRLVPVSVVEGFTAGIGAIILIGQLPRVLGLPAPDDSHISTVFTHLRELFHEAKPASALVAAVTVALVFGLPKIHRRIPAPLLGVAIPTVVIALTGIDVPLIGELPSSLPLPSIPRIPPGSDLRALIGAAFVVYALGSLESLLSSAAVDKMARRSKRHDPDQELIGQGLGNIASALVGGIPVTGVIARSALNCQAGARTRLSAIVHSFVLIASVFLFSSFMARIPIAALAGVLVAVALRMLNPASFRLLWRVSRPDATVYAITFLIIVGVDLIAGIQWGVGAALLIAAVRLGQTHMGVLAGDTNAALQVHLQGPITFLASLKVESLREDLERLSPGARVAIDLSGVTTIDASGAELLVDLARSMRSRQIDVALLVTDRAIERRLLASDDGGNLGPYLARTQQDVARILATHAGMSAHQRLELGVENYRRQQLPRYADLFERLASGQVPHTLFITCSDSRIEPALLTSTDPGELFILRNIGNMVPRWSETAAPSPVVAVEYAVGALHVSQIVVCAHSRCGAIHALMHPDEIPDHLTAVHAWVREEESRELCRRLPTSIPEEEVARLSALLQLDHLRTFPIVREKLERGTLSLRAWFFDVASGSIEEWNETTEHWNPVGGSAQPLEELDRTGPAGEPTVHGSPRPPA